MDMEYPNSLGFDELDFTIKGEGIEKFLASDDNRRAFKNDLRENSYIDLDNDEHCRNLVEILDDLERGGEILSKKDNGEFLPSFGSLCPKALEALRGIGGCCTTTLLAVILNNRPRCKVYGKITKYEFNNQTPPNFSPSNEKRPNQIGVGSGILSVEMIIESFFTHQNLLSGNPDRKEFLDWDIEIAPCGYEVLKAIPNPDNEKINPFPNTVDFPPEAIDPENCNSVWKRHLDHKLFAEGHSISVVSVHRRINDHPCELLPSGHHHYAVTNSSCIDLMFKGSPPKTTEQLPPQRNYCLGRCLHPTIINTNGA